MSSFIPGGQITTLWGFTHAIYYKRKPTIVMYDIRMVFRIHLHSIDAWLKYSFDHRTKCIQFNFYYTNS